MTTALTFNDVQFDVIPQNSQPWVRGSQIATALRYSSVQRVIELYTRHADEFTPAMTAVVTLPTEGGPQETRIFSLRGCHLLAMFARTPVAKQFRRWVLDVLDRLALEERAALPSQSTPSTADDRKPLRALVHAWAQVAGVHHAALWPQVKAHFQLSRIDDLPAEWIPDALAFVQGKIDELAKAKALPASTKRLPIYRDGCYYLPHVNKRHVPGPQEAALAALWKAWPYREAELKRAFAALGREIDDACAKLFHYAISDLGRNADTMFSPDAMLEGFFLAQSTARPLFDEALHRVRTHLRMSLNVAVMLGR